MHIAFAIGVALRIYYNIIKGGLL